MSMSELEINLGTATMNCSPDDVAATFAALLHDIRAVARKLRADERVALRMIMSRESGALTVGEVFRGFTRESEGHKTLRRLRAAQFVRPTENGCWEAAGRIEVKAFAKLLWDHIGEGAIFSEERPDREEEPEHHEEEAAIFKMAPVQEDDAINLEAPEPAEPSEPGLRAAPVVRAEPAEPAEPVDVEKQAAAIWEDDDVLDLRDYSQEELRQKT